MDRNRIYDIIYALIAREGRGTALFGDFGILAREAFQRSLVEGCFPELWFEFPLAGEPWLDLHALTSLGDVAGTTPTYLGQSGIYDKALAWFAGQEQEAVRQLALSYDLHAGDIDTPAVQMLANGHDKTASLGFLEAVGRSDAKEAYRTFLERMPKEWYACYLGTFPGRLGEGDLPWVRVECLINNGLQQAYAEHATLIREHLARVGMTWLGDEEVSAIQGLARSPFPIEFQFDVGAQGEALPVISTSLRFAPEDWTDPERRELVGEVLRGLLDARLADERLELLQKTLYSIRLTQGDQSVLLACHPVYVKLRLREGEEPFVKAYLMTTCTE